MLCLASLVMALLLCGSSTALAKGGLASLLIESQPPGAQVVVAHNTVGVTPARLQVAADRPLSVHLQLKGYKAEILHIPALRTGQTSRVAVRLRRR